MSKLKFLLRHLMVALVCFSPSLVVAQTTEEMSLCKLTSTLKGSIRYFWVWGRDAWIGTGQITCGSTVKSVRVMLNSWNNGLGANQDNVIELTVNSFAVSRLNSLLGSFRTYTDDKKNANFNEDVVVLYANAETVSWTVGLRSVGKSPINFKSSINYGQLTIETAEEIP